MPYRPIPPMEKDEYRDVVRSVILKFFASIITAGVFMYLSVINLIPFDALSCAFIGFFLMFCAGGKLFPESTKYTSVRARNYRRSRKGLPPLDPEDEPAAEVITDFQRRG